MQGFIRARSSGNERRKDTIKCAAAATIAALVLVHSTRAANTYTWNNAGATDFNTAGNWTPATIPGAAGNDIAAFTGASAANPNVRLATTIGQITFAAGTTGYDITASAGISLKLGSGSIISASNTSGTNTIDAPIILNQANGTAGLTQTTGGTLVLNGLITSANAGVGISINGGSGTTAATSNLIKITGTNNTFTGPIQIGTGGSGGVVSINKLGLAGGSNSSLGQGNIFMGQIGLGTQYDGINYTGGGETSDKIITLQTGNFAANSFATRGIDTTGATGALVITSNIVATDTIATAGTNAGSTFQLNGSGTYGDTIKGTISNGTNGKVALSKIGAGTWTLAGAAANTFTGTTTVGAGELDLNKTSVIAVAGNVTVGDGAGGADADVLKLLASNQIATLSAITVASSGKFDLNGGSNTVASLSSTGGDIASTTGGGNLTVTAAPAFSGTGNTIGTGATVNSSTTATLAASGALTVNGTLSDGLSMGTSASLTGSGTVGALALTGSNAITGTLTAASLVSGGGANSITTGTLGTGAATINSGSTLSVNGTLSNSGVLAVNGTLKGGGTVGALSVNSGGTLSPGNSPGTLNTGDATYAGGGNYAFELNGVSGKGTAYDWENITGQLNVTATAFSKFNIVVTSLTAANVHGALVGFNGSTSYAWILATASGGFGGTFDPTKFNINTAAFTDVNTASGTFAVSTSGNDLLLTYSVPEPASIAVLACAAIGMGGRRRKSVV